MRGFGFRRGLGFGRRGGGAAFDPLSLSPALWLRADDITGFANGAAITTDWPDRSGNARNATPSSGPLYRASAFGGQPGVEFNSAGRKFVTPSFLGAGYNTALTMYAVVDRVAASGLKVWASNQDTAIYAAKGTGAYIYDANLSDAAIESPHNGSSPVIANVGNGNIIRFSYNGTHKRLSLFDDADHRSAVEAATGNLGLSGALTIGELSSGGYGWDGTLMELLVFNSVPSAADDLAVVTYLSSRYGLGWSSAPRVFFDGNSITGGTGASAQAMSYPSQTMAQVAGWDWYNYGVPSATTADRANVAINITTTFGAYRENNVAILWEVTNDLYFNNDAAAAITRYAAWCSDVRAAGFYVIAMTVLPRTQGGMYAGFEADRQTVNTSIRANWSNYADALIDVAADSIMGDPASTLATVYYADGIHPTDAGYTRIANMVAPVLAAL